MVDREAVSCAERESVASYMSHSFVPARLLTPSPLKCFVPARLATGTRQAKQPSTAAVGVGGGGGGAQPIGTLTSDYILSLPSALIESQVNQT
jgi:hypothetical protein